jgi:Polyketide cyclase / dehydrase and lipid transport
MGLFKRAALVGLGLAAGLAFAQAAAAATPEYAVVVQSIDVAKPADVVWKKVGGFCSIHDWLAGGRLTCVYTTGDGGVGTNRLLAGRINEVMVSKTDLSYTYTQPLSPIDYHGSVEVKPTSATTSKLIYTLFWDQAPLPDQAAKDKDKAGRAGMFMGALKAMKALSEAP